MISHLAFGSGSVPSIQPMQVATIVVPLDRAMPGSDYDVSILRTARLAGEALQVVRKTETTVTVEIKLHNGNAGRISFWVVAHQQVGQPATTPPDTTHPPVKDK
jgi:hypothetical protein